MKYNVRALLSIRLPLQKERGNAKWKKKKKKGSLLHLLKVLGTPDSLVCGSWTPLSEPLTHF